MQAPSRYVHSDKKNPEEKFNSLNPVLPLAKKSNFRSAPGVKIMCLRTFKNKCLIYATLGNNQS